MILGIAIPEFLLYVIGMFVVHMIAFGIPVLFMYLINKEEDFYELLQKNRA